MEWITRSLVALGLCTLVGCGESSPEDVAVAFERGLILEGDEGVLDLLTADEAQALQSQADLCGPDCRGIAEVDLVELQRLIEPRVRVTPRTAKINGDEAEVTLSVELPNLIEMVDGLAGTSWVDYFSGDPEERKPVEAQLLQTYEGHPWPMEKYETTTALERGPDGWRVNAGFRRKLVEKEEKARVAHAYLAQHITPRTQRVRPVGTDFVVYSGWFKNAGDRTIAKYRSKVYYLSSEGERVGEQSTEWGYGSVAPGYEFVVRDSFYRDDAPKSWSGVLEIEITEIELASSQDTPGEQTADAS